MIADLCRWLESLPDLQLMALVVGPLVLLALYSWLSESSRRRR